MRIGFFDSGVGGITVLHEALHQLPHEGYIYFADTDHVPYGTKSKDEVLQYVLEAVDFMAAEGIKALVVACNTATSIAIKQLRQRYSFPILGMEPAVKPAVEKCCSKRILVMATPLTLKEEKYQNLVTRLDHEHLVDGEAFPELVTYAEEFHFERKEITDYLRNKLAGHDLDQYGTVVLGCTHFPYFKNILKQLFPEGTNIIDGSIGTVGYLKKVLEDQDLLSVDGQGDILFYSSGRREPQNSRYTKYLDFLSQLKSIESN